MPESLSETLLPHILLVEDNALLAEMYETFLQKQGCKVTCVYTARSAINEIDQKKVDVVLLNIKLPDINGLEVMDNLRDRNFYNPVIVITGQSSINMAVDAMRKGAKDFLVKPFSVHRLEESLKKVLSQAGGQQKSSLQEREANAKEVSPHKRDFGGFIGTSRIMQKLYQKLENAARSRAPVFITGEPGTGKKTCAEAIHKYGPRKDRPFIPINCATIPKDLIESELFGHVKGAFTDSTKDREGAVSIAEGGTLFLDEIAEMTPDMQTKFFYFLQNKTYRKMDGTALEGVDIRIICATNKDPHRTIREGQLRQDLFYRLHVIPVHMPPLYMRGEDIIDIAHAMLNEYAKQEGKALRHFAKDVEIYFSSYSWPGNIRELQNVIQNIVVMNDGEIVTSSMLPDYMKVGKFTATASSPKRDAHGRKAARCSARSTSDTPPGGLEAAAGDFYSGQADRSRFIDPLEQTGRVIPLWLTEKRAIEQAIILCAGNIPKAAALLEISPSTIYRKRAEWKKELACRTK